MKITKILSVIIAIVLIFGAFSICTTAEENQSIWFNLLVNDEYYTYDEIPVKLNETLKIEVANVLIEDEEIDQSLLSYKWEKSCPAPDGMPGLMFEVIADATESVYSTLYDGAQRYKCTVTVAGVGERSMEIWLKEDTLNVSASSNKEIVFEEEEKIYYINDLSVGDEVTLTINATSTLQGANITYSWDGGDAYIKPDSDLEEWGQITNNTNTLTVTKREGQQNYCCIVNDGNVTHYIHIFLMPKESITANILANGEYPGTYAGTYIYVTKPSSNVKIEIPATSSEGDVKYTWYYDAEGYSIPVRIDNTSDTVIATKSPMTEQNPYAWEVYQCYLEDGNDRVRFWIMLFCLDPEKPLSEIEKIGEDTPEIEIKSENEDLANAVFTGDELNDLSCGAPLEITLSAELKQIVSEEEKYEIDEKLAANSNVGMYLDINIYKGFKNYEADQVAELNKPIEISVDMPETLINKDANVKREYSIVRVHNGVAETIPCTYDATSNKIDFSSDKFSTYTIVYTDTEVSNAGGGEPGIADKNDAEKETPNSNKNDVTETKSPSTSDNSATGLWLLLISLSSVAVVTLLYFKKHIGFIKN